MFNRFLKSKLAELRIFFKDKIWRIDINQISKPKRILIQTIKVLILAFRGFNEDQCQIKASALTFFSILSVVPVLALAFAISKGFGVEKVLEETIRESLAGHETVTDYILSFSRSMLENTKGEVIVGVGIVLLLFAVMRLLNHIENIFNQMWEVKHSRSFARKFTDYFSIMLISPILIVLASSLTVYLSTMMNELPPEFRILSYTTPLIPYALMWLMFTSLYIIMPHTKVSFKAALIAGIISGSLYQILQWGYINFQVGVSRYNAIYGSFAALPLFLIWMQLSWEIILLGGEISFAIHNIKKFRIQEEDSNINHYSVKNLSLLIIYTIIERFKSGKQPYLAADIANLLKIPQRDLKKLINMLVDANILIETRTNEDHVFGYVPSMDINKITVSTVIERIEKLGKNVEPFEENKQFYEIKKYVDNILLKFKSSDGSKLITELI